MAKGTIISEERKKAPTKNAPLVAGVQPQLDFAPSPSLQRNIQDPHSLRPADILYLQRTSGNRAVANLIASSPAKTSSPLMQHTPVIQRTPVDPAGNSLKTPPLPTTPDPNIMKRLADTDLLKDLYIFADQQAYEDYILKNDSSRGKFLPGVTQANYLAHLGKAQPVAEHRQSIFPMKKRTRSIGGKGKNVFVQDNDDFHKLTPHQMPEMPEGNFLYQSRKTKKYKVRGTPSADKNWKMAMHQEKLGSPVAFNMLHDKNYLDRTLFQYGEGSSKGARQMAGLEGKGKTPKWKDPSVDTRGKRRKLNQPNHKALVQGHGQDYENTMKWFGDYDSSNFTKNMTLSPSVGTIKHSDNHPANFSPEHPVYGQNYRNYILNRAKKSFPGGSIMEQTVYFSQTIPVEVPTGFATVKIPQRKKLTILDSSGIPQEHYELDQLVDNKDGTFSYVDYAEIAEKFAGKKAGEADMEDLRLASKMPVPSLSDSHKSFVEPTSTSDINSPSPMTLDDPSVKNDLTTMNQPFFFFKPTDFK